MIREEFEKIILLIGFENVVDKYYFYFKNKGMRIYLNDLGYGFYNGLKWEKYDYINLIPIKKHFENELRSIKLKKLLK